MVPNQATRVTNTAARLGAASCARLAIGRSAPAPSPYTTEAGLIPAATSRVFPPNSFRARGVVGRRDFSPCRIAACLGGPLIRRMGAGLSRAPDGDETRVWPGSQRARAAFIRHTAARADHTPNDSLATSGVGSQVRARGTTSRELAVEARPA